MEHKQPLLPSNTVIDWITPDDIQHETLRSAAAYWTQLRGDRPWPSREELNFRDMARFVPYMSLVRVIGDGADFEHRIVGDVIVRAFAVPIQNRRFSEIARDAPVLIGNSFRLFRKVLETRAPVAARRQTGLSREEVAFMYAEMIYLPLGHTTDCINHIIAFGFHEACAISAAASATAG